MGGQNGSVAKQDVVVSNNKQTAERQDPVGLPGGLARRGRPSNSRGPGMGATRYYGYFGRGRWGVTVGDAACSMHFTLPRRLDRAGGFALVARSRMRRDADAIAPSSSAAASRRARSSRCRRPCLKMSSAAPSHQGAQRHGALSPFVPLCSRRLAPARPCSIPSANPRSGYFVALRSSPSAPGYSCMEYRSSHYALPSQPTAASRPYAPD